MRADDCTACIAVLIPPTLTTSYAVGDMVGGINSNDSISFIPGVAMTGGCIGSRHCEQCNENSASVG